MKGRGVVCGELLFTGGSRLRVCLTMTKVYFLPLGSSNIGEMVTISPF